jgi:hypothetical protein
VDYFPVQVTRPTRCPAFACDDVSGCATRGAYIVSPVFWDDHMLGQRTHRRSCARHLSRAVDFVEQNARERELVYRASLPVAPESSR